MNESQFRERWLSEKAIYDAWGQYVVERTCSNLEREGFSVDGLLKVPATHRVKDDESLIDKAFYRPGKNYEDRYNDIEDKVGARFVVLLLADITRVCDAIVNEDTWSFDECRHFEIEKEQNPLLFTYQSVHYILRPKAEFHFNGETISPDKACEVQVRTLLQHAYAELTHDGIYKPKRTVKPSVQRTVAKSMALIETTDEFFKEVTEQLNSGPVEDFDIVRRLDSLYESFTGLSPYMAKSGLVVLEEFSQFLGDETIEDVQKTLQKNQFLSETILKKYQQNNFYHQSVVLFIYWLLSEKKNRLVRDWPLEQSVLYELAGDIGVSVLDE